MKLTEHFDRSEFACSDKCGFDTVDYELLTILETLRNHFNKPVIINSGARCRKHNASIGSPNSLHTIGRAADFWVKDVPIQEVHNWLTETYKNRLGIGLYVRGNGGWIHLDTRKEAARWLG